MKVGVEDMSARCVEEYVAMGTATSDPHVREEYFEIWSIILSKLEECSETEILDDIVRSFRIAVLAIKNGVNKAISNKMSSHLRHMNTARYPRGSEKSSGAPSQSLTCADFYSGQPEIQWISVGLKSN